MSESQETESGRQEQRRQENQVNMCERETGTEKQREIGTDCRRQSEAKCAGKTEAVIWRRVQIHFYVIYIFKGHPVYEELCIGLPAQVNAQ